MTNTRLVAVLGYGRENAENGEYYVPAKYSLDGITLNESLQLVEIAIADLIGMTKDDEIVLLATKRVQERWFGADNKWMKNGGDRHVEPQIVPIEDGVDYSDCIAIFNKAKDAVFANVLSEDELPDRLIIDVTHGFRVQPMILISALNFAVSEWKRKGFSKLPEIRVLYGAFMPGQLRGAETSIWDITYVIRAAEWNSAIDAVIRYGRADDFHTLSNAQKRDHQGITTREGHRLIDWLKVLGEAVKKFDDNLSTARSLDILSSAQNVVRLCREQGEDGTGFVDVWNGRVPVQSAVEKLVKELDMIQGGNVISREGLKSLGGLALYYGRIQRYAEQAACLREGCLVKFIVSKYEQNQIIQPRQEGFDGFIEKCENEFKSWVALHKNQNHPRPSENFADFVDSMRSTRNDIEHMGFKQNARSAEDLIKALQRDAETFNDYIDNIDKPIDVSDHRSGFLNLSNHPIDTWSDSQKNGAIELGHGKPVELDGGMPLVPENATEKDVGRMAKEILAQALKQNVSAAYVAGEFSLTYALVNQLKMSGIKCYTATTERVSKETRQEDGSIKTEKTFRFVKWRAYC